MNFLGIRIMKAMRTAIRLHATSGLAPDSPTRLRVEAFLAALVEDAVAQLPAGALPADLREALVSGEAVGPKATFWWPHVRAWFEDERLRLARAGGSRH